MKWQSLGAALVALAPLSVSPASAAARLPGFAISLSQQPLVNGPSDWVIVPADKAWASLARAHGAGRQAARWSYAKSLVGQGHWAEALAVLDVMAADDPDIGLAASWRLARGAALVGLGRYDEALNSLAVDELAFNPEACAWKARLFSEEGDYQQALAQIRCALPAINARKDARRLPFVLAAARAGIGTGQAALALRFLDASPDHDPAANLWRGKAYCALRQVAPGEQRLAAAAKSDDPDDRASAALALVECKLADHSLTSRQALMQLDRIGFAWRGGPVEQQALQMSWRLASQAGDLRSALKAGATLFRHFNLGAEATPMLTSLRQQLGGALAGQTLSVDQAAGLYWDFRDLAPSGAEGDLLVSQLADRLDAAGLYGRAAELLHYQLGSRTTDIAQGPLSAKVARLFILAGQPLLAIKALQETEATPYPAEMRWERHRVEAAALQLLGRTAEALAVLSDVPDSAALRSEIYWKQRDWARLVGLGSSVLPRGSALNDAEQAIVLRHAIGLAMLGRNADLAELRRRYGGLFANLPTAATFALLTGPAGSIDPDMISRAMAALPGASPAGDFADLVDATPTRARSLG